MYLFVLYIHFRRSLQGKYTEGKTKKVIERRYAVKLNTEHDVNNITEITTNCCFLARKNVRLMQQYIRGASENINLN